REGERRRPRRDASRRRQPASPARAPALRAALRGPSLRPPRDRHARAGAGTHARNACRILPASLRAGNVRSRRGRRGGPAAGAGDGERDVRPAAARGRAAPARRTAAPFRPQRQELTHPGAHAHLGMAWPATRLDHADTPALDLLVSILGRSRSSRLVQALRERDGLVVSIGASFSALEGAGGVTVSAELPPANVDRAEAEVLAEIRRIRDTGVTEAELRRAITAAEAEHEFETETAEGRARALGRAETMWTLEDELAYVNRIRSVTAVQVRAVARRYLDPARYTRLALLPPGGAR